MRYYVLVASPSDGYYGTPLAVDKLFTREQVIEINRAAKEKYKTPEMENLVYAEDEDFNDDYYYDEETPLTMYVQNEMGLKEIMIRREWENVIWKELKEAI